jgi:hypothetical protein
LFGQTAGDGVHIGARLLDADAGFEPRDHRQTVIPAIVHFRRSEAEWQIKIDLRGDSEARWDLTSLWELKTGRRHADDGIGSIVQCDLLSDDFRVSVITLLPQPVAKDDYAISAHQVFFG